MTVCFPRHSPWRWWWLLLLAVLPAVWPVVVAFPARETTAWATTRTIPSRRRCLATSTPDATTSRRTSRSRPCHWWTPPAHDHSYASSLWLFRGGSDDSDDSESESSESDDGNGNADQEEAAATAAAAAEATKARQQTALLNSSVGGMVLVSGMADFVTKGSKIRLLAGSIAGGLLLLSGRWIFPNNHNRNPNYRQGSSAGPTKGYQLASVVAGGLTIVLGRRYFQTGSYVPTGILATLAVITLFYNLVDALVDASEQQGQG